MIIPIDENTRIKGTEACWQLEYRTVVKSGKTAGEESWSPAKYCSSFRSALSQALQREIRTHPAEGIAAALEAAESLSIKYAAILDSNILRGVNPDGNS